MTINKNSTAYQIMHGKIHPKMYCVWTKDKSGKLSCKWESTHHVY